MRTFKEYNLDKKLDKLVSDEIKKRKLAKFPVNATDLTNQHSNFLHQIVT